MTSEFTSRPAFQDAYDLCVQKIRRTLPRLAAAPKSCSFDPNGDYFQWPEGFFEIGNWTSSFFSGMGLIGYENSGDASLLREVNKLSEAYTDKLYRHGADTMHDLGFLYSLYSVALWKLTGSFEQRGLGLKAAEELAKRFVPSGGYIRAWGRMDEHTTDYAGLAIIDCLMNLPLLFWASAETGNRFFHEIAVIHANTTAKYFVRADGSVCHAYRIGLDPVHTREDNYCGAAIGTHWARGSAWAIYGFALAYAYTRQTPYLQLARKVGDKFLESLDSEGVPIWDFKRRPSDSSVRDSSAASIAACAFYEIAELDPSGGRYRDQADRLISKLIENHLDRDLDIPGVLKNGQVGAGKSAYTSWGDYFLMEAISRRLFRTSRYW